MLGSFICLYAVLALYGTALLYREIADNGCDPSGGVIGNETCESNGPGVFGAMLGVAFAGASSVAGLFWQKVSHISHSTNIPRVGKFLVAPLQPRALVRLEHS